MKLSRPGQLVLCAVFVCIGSFAAAQASKSGYRLVQKITFDAAPGATREYFDYIFVDSAARRAYLSHGADVKVVDADSGKPVGIVEGFKQNHGIAVASEFGRGYVTDSAQGKVIVFDLKTLKVTGEAKAEKDADCVIYDPASKQVFTMNGDAHNSTAIDAKTGNVVGTVDLGGQPEFAVADGKGMIYINLENTNEVVAVDAAALTVKSRWPVAPVGGPTGIAMDTAHRRLFSAGRNPQMLAVLNADTGKVIQSFPITAGVDAVAYDPGTGMIFVPTREGVIHIFHEDAPDTFSAVDTITTEYGAKTLGLDTKTHKLFVDTADFGPAPAATAGQPNPRRPAIPGTFHALVYGR
jgi:DNA-binding beta-propeller fold protein YncE